MTIDIDKKIGQGFDLMIIWKYGRKDIITDVLNYGILSGHECFYFDSGVACSSHRTFIPIDNIAYFGAAEDYKLKKDKEEQLVALDVYNTKRTAFLKGIFSRGNKDE